MHLPENRQVQHILICIHHQSSYTSTILEFYYSLTILPSFPSFFGIHYAPKSHAILPWSMSQSREDDQYINRYKKIWRQRGWEYNPDLFGWRRVRNESQDNFWRRLQLYWILQYDKKLSRVVNREGRSFQISELAWAQASWKECIWWNHQVLLELRGEGKIGEVGKVFGGTALPSLKL